MITDVITIDEVDHTARCNVCGFSGMFHDPEVASRVLFQHVAYRHPDHQIKLYQQVLRELEKADD